jgi:hypothetical protein
LKIKRIERNGLEIAVIESAETIITDVRSALDLMATVRYGNECDRIAIPKSAVVDDFFVLSTGIAGEVLQKFVTYSCKLAIFGDYSAYTSKSLRDFIYESNNGSHVFFVTDEDEAILKLTSGICGESENRGQRT